MIFTRMKKVLLAQMPDLDLDSIKMDTSLIGDMELSSLTLMLLVCNLEQEFGIEIPYTVLPGFVTIGDVHDYLEKVCPA